MPTGRRGGRPPQPENAGRRPSAGWSERAEAGTRWLSSAVPPPVRRQRSHGSASASEAPGPSIGHAARTDPEKRVRPSVRSAVSAIEYEVKVLEIDVDQVVRRILDKGGTDLTGENATKVYARQGIDLATITDLRFGTE